MSSIYKKGGQVRRIHNLIYVPDFDSAERLSAKLAQLGNLSSDGRPILGLDARDLLEIVLETHPQAFLVPAHVWTPWFALFGSKSGFDSVEECFGDLSEYIFAMETGLSSDPAMNRLWSALDRFALISNSDAHSGDKLAREANIFSGAPSYCGILQALKQADTEHHLIETVEFFSEEGKYHLDGHRSCGICLTPDKTKDYAGKCPVCGKPLTIGVLNRVMSLADRDAPLAAENDTPFSSLVPLVEIISELLGSGRTSRKVTAFYGRCLDKFGSELNILKGAPEKELYDFFQPLGEAVSRMRKGKVIRSPGFDGQFGKISLFDEQEKMDLRGGRLFSLSAVQSNKNAQSRPPKKQTGLPAQPEEISHETSMSGALYNERQSSAIEAGPNPILVQAGPGTGKTHTLIGRVLHLINAGEAPRHILTVTFTRKAAAELESRLYALLDEQLAVPRTDTLHALAFEYWRQVHGGPPTVLSEEAAWRVFCEANPDYPKNRLAQFWKELVLARERRTQADADTAEAMLRYNKNKQSWNLTDYTDLLEFWLEQIENHQFANPYTHILVDEVQDLTKLQLEIVTALAPAGGNGFFAIGDPKQSIYAFRGACPDVENYLRQKWPEIELISLAENYRSSEEILEVASALFPDSAPLRSLKGAKRPVNLFEAQDTEQETAWMARHINNLIGGSAHSLVDRERSRQDSHAELSPGDIAILVRFKALATAMAKSLNNYGILCSIPAAEAFWHDPKVRLILNSVGRTLGIAQESELEELDCPDKIFTKDPGSMAVFLQDHRLFDHFFWQSAAFKELKIAYKQRDGWLGLINWINLQSDLEQVRKRGERVQIITLHTAKGLEFDTIFMPGLEEGILPFHGMENLIDGIPPLNDNMPEELRLFYVGLTRAKERLFLSWSHLRNLYGRSLRQSPSSFLKLLPAEKLKTSTMVARTEYKEKQLSLL